MDACLENKVHVVYCDKSYTHRAWHGFHPLHYFQSVSHPSDRWKKPKITLKPPREKGDHIIFAGCSHKFAAWHNFDIHDYARRIISEIRSHTRRPIVYRPKRSSVPPPSIPGTRYSHAERKIEHELENAHALVTFSSNAAVDAIFHGVPVFVLGPSIAKPVAN